MDYLKKYLKYKTKYLTLTNYIDNKLDDQDGGKKQSSRRKKKKLYRNKHKNKELNVNIHNAKRLDDEGMVYMIDPSTIIYYCDRLRKYQFKCGKLGLILLTNLILITKRLIQKNNELLIGKNNDEINLIRKRGYDLYAEKPLLKKKLEKDEIPGTWTNDEYGDSGLQWMYIRHKSYQRFTETWALLERCINGGLLNFSNSNMRIVSLGGGPGFELLAFDLFMRNIHNNAINTKLPNMEYVSLDFQQNWDIYVKELGYEFNQWNVHNSDNSKIIGTNNKDIICILSNILSVCSNEKTADLFSNLLCNYKVNCILMNERGKIQSMVKLLEKRNIVVYHLLDQSFGTDDRQVVFFPPNTKLNYILNDPPTFPNQPFVRNK